MAVPVDEDHAPRRPSAVVLMGERTFADLFDDERRARLHQLVRVDDPPRSHVDDPDMGRRLADVEYLLTGWGVPHLGAEVLAVAPKLRAVVHCGGSVKHLLGQAFWDRGVTVTSAADANAIPVAEFTLATILLEAKRVPSYVAGYAQHRDVDGSWREVIPPAVTYGGTVGIVGLSRVGRRVADLLRAFDVEVLVADPYADAAAAAAVGARLTGLDDLLRASDVVSIHAPELPETHHLLDARRIGMLRPHAVLINTARGSLIDTDAVIARCRAGVLRAVLDVTDPEPLPADSPLFTTPGVVLSPHVAGAMHAETLRLADSALDDLEALVLGRAPRHRVDGASLGIIA